MKLDAHSILVAVALAGMALIPNDLVRRLAFGFVVVWALLMAFRFWRARRRPVRSGIRPRPPHWSEFTGLPEEMRLASRRPAYGGARRETQSEPERVHGPWVAYVHGAAVARGKTRQEAVGRAALDHPGSRPLIVLECDTDDGAAEPLGL